MTAPPYTRARALDRHAKHPRAQATLTGGTTSRVDGRIAGHLLARVRASLGLTQEGLAERAGVDVGTVQGWESGRRPLAAVPSGTLLNLYLTLTVAGATVDVPGLFGDALQADVVISQAATTAPLPPSRHPLGALVRRRSFMEMLSWPLSGDPPPAVAQLKPGRLSAPAPVLHAPERHALFDHLQAAADQATRHGDTGAVLHHQAVYLLSYDPRTATRDWLAGQQRRALTGRHDGHLPSWVAARSAAVAVAFQGDPGPLAHFAHVRCADETAETANLNYWAYWVGEIPGAPRDDGFMLSTGVDEWDGGRLLTHLLARTTAGSPCLTLNAHTLWSLLARRPALLEHHPRLRAQTAQHVTALLDHPLPPVTRRELAAVVTTTR